mmetsp:Transcript_51679/g.113278  ORF Transcript_51679/g.113278 Transcript_51679/m.113278 type:complete len:201 (-) Transcript_51679:222-824(-)
MAAAGTMRSSILRPGWRCQATGWMRSFVVAMGSGKDTKVTPCPSVLPSNAAASSALPPNGAPNHCQVPSSDRYSSFQLVVHCGAMSQRLPSWLELRLKYASTCNIRFVSPQFFPVMISCAESWTTVPSTPAAAFSEALFVRRMSSSKNCVFTSRDISLKASMAAGICQPFWPAPRQPCFCTRVTAISWTNRTGGLMKDLS